MNTRDKVGTSSAFVCERKAKPPRTSSFYLWCNDLRLHDGKYMTHELSGRVLVGSHRCVGSCGRHGQSAIQAHRRLDGRPGSSRLRAVRLEVDSLQAPIRRRPDRLLEALRHIRCPQEPNGRARLPNPCCRLVTALAGAPQAQRSVRPERVSGPSLSGLISPGRRWRFGGVGRRSRTVFLDLLLRACASTHPCAHSRARLAHTWFDLILKERYLQRAIPNMPGRRSCTYCRSGTPPRRAASRAAAVAAIRRSNLPWKRATLL